MTNDSLLDVIGENLRSVRRQIDEAADRVGRDAGDVMLLPVTKMVGVEETRALAQLGVPAVGENRVMDALRKAEALALPELAWHLIGHLQRNKVRKALQLFTFLHGVDSLRLAEAVSEELVRLGRELPCLIEVNTSDEPQKHGLAPEELMPLLEAASGLLGLRVDGLMTMAMMTDDPEKARPCFARLRKLAERVRAADLPNVRMTHLSMGMTQDFDVAVEEGATIVRVGTAIFRGL